MSLDNLSVLIDLLDDPDYEVYNAVSMQLLSKGVSIIPDLELAWEKSSNEIVQSRIENILQQIQTNQAYIGLKNWIKSGAEDVLLGAYWVARNQYSDLLFSKIEREVEKFRNRIWVELNDSLTALEKVRIINHFLYDSYNFSNEQDFMKPSYCFINHVLDTRKGNPVTLAIIYMAVCWRLDLPVYCLCVPRNFLLVYNDVLLDQELFFINPFYKGLPLSRADIEEYLKQMKIESRNEYFHPRSNKACILRLIETLVYIYEQEGNTAKVDIYKRLIPLFKGENTYFQEEE